VTALTLSGLPPVVWQVRSHSDAAARALADPHDPRRTCGAPWVGPPGRVLVLVTPCERAAWVTHWPYPHLTLDGLDAWRRSLFRNEATALLSSALIVSAMATTAAVWAAWPRDGWLTWVDPAKGASPNPGYSFQRAGWTRDRSTGTTIMVARALGRLGIGVDLAASYCRTARWRVFDPRQAAKAVARTWTERQPIVFDHQGGGR
jgi:hypothetical protein